MNDPARNRARAGFAWGAVIGGLNGAWWAAGLGVTLLVSAIQAFQHAH